MLNLADAPRDPTLDCADIAKPQFDLLMIGNSSLKLGASLPEEIIHEQEGLWFASGCMGERIPQRL